MDLQENYLRAVLGFLGITDMRVVHSEGLAVGKEAVNPILSGSQSAVEALIAA